MLQPYGHFVMIAHHPSHQSTYSKSLGTETPPRELNP